MPSDLDLCRIVARSYTNATWWAGEISALYTFVDGRAVLAIPGTKREIGEWLDDFDAVPMFDRVLGICHLGFRDCTRDLYRAIPVDGLIPANTIIVGHSLGGALALLLGGLFTAFGKPPVAVVTFGAPRCGSWGLRRILAPVPVRSYRNGNDPVPDVPWLPGVYVRPRDQIKIGKACLDPITDHHIESYEASMAGNNNASEARMDCG